MASVPIDPSGNVPVDVESGGGGGSSVTIVNPLDGSGNVKVAVENIPTVDAVITSPLDGGNVAVKVENFPATQPISAASLPLPTGAATSAKQPALGTPGTPSADVLSVQGESGMTPFLSNIRGNIGGILDAILGSAIPANAIQIGGSDGTDLRAISTDNSGRVALAIGSKATYRCATSFAPAASVSSQPNFVIKGSASKVVKITKIRFSMYAGTGSSTPSSIRLQRYNSVSGGIGSTVNPAQNDPNDASPTAVVTSYTSNPTIGISAGVGQSDIFDYQLTTVSATTAPAPPPVELLFGELNSTEPLVLRGASDFLGIAITQVGTSPIASIMIEWTEE